MKPLRHLLAALYLALAGAPAQACLFLQSIEPAQWYAWSSALFAAEVTRVEEDRGRALDLITLRVTETFKGPQGDAATATVQIPQRFWGACRQERPAAGAAVLVAMHASGDVQLLPLAAGTAEALRALIPPREPMRLQDVESDNRQKVRR